MGNDWQMAESFIARLNSRCKMAESYYNQLNQQKQQIAIQLRALKAEIDELNSEIMLATHGSHIGARQCCEKLEGVSTKLSKASSRLD